MAGKIKVFGFPKNFKSAKKILNINEEKCYIHPNNVWKQRWMIWISILLLYSAIFVPVKVAFYDDSSNFMIGLDFFIDACFLTDIVLTFFSAYEKKDGSIEADKRQIAKEYLKAWFWIDIMSTIPVEVFDIPAVENILLNALEKKQKGGAGSQKLVKLIRLARLPRLYRIVRILRLLKMISFIKKNKTI
jgi:hyperpolarization activated cyclic nucleotide-gated potassium channel 2